jgi:hypothetical protein
MRALIDRICDGIEACTSDAAGRNQLKQFILRMSTITMTYHFSLPM